MWSYVEMRSPLSEAEDLKEREATTDRQTAASRIEPVPVHERATPHRGGGAVAVRALYY